MKEYCLGFCFDSSGNNVCLIQKNKPHWQRGQINGVGGKIEEHETPVQAMKREFEEETGLSIPGWQHCITLAASDVAWVVYIFKAYVPLEYLQKIRQTTEEQPCIVNIQSLPSNVIFNLRWIIPLLLDGIRWPVHLFDRAPNETCCGS